MYGAPLMPLMPLMPGLIALAGVTADGGVQGDAGVAASDAAVGESAQASRAGRPKATLDYELRTTPDGSGDLVYEESAFVARVAVDGAVSFRDRGTKISFWPPFLPVKRATPGVPSLQATLSALARGRKPHAPEGEPPDDSFLIIPNVTPFRPDPREGCPGCSFRPLLLPLNASGQLDLTEELIRFSGGDPHRLEKARFLAGTRERRIRMAVAAHAGWVRRATTELPGHLDEIACDERRTRSERRAILRALRDEMNASPEGRAAAATISAFLETRFEHPDADSGCGAGRRH
jgi:hypothetical protein